MFAMSILCLSFPWSSEGNFFTAVKGYRVKWKKKRGNVIPSEPFRFGASAGQLLASVALKVNEDVRFTDAPVSRSPGDWIGSLTRRSSRELEHVNLCLRRVQHKKRTALSLPCISRSARLSALCRATPRFYVARARTKFTGNWYESF